MSGAAAQKIREMKMKTNTFSGRKLKSCTMVTVHFHSSRNGRTYVLTYCQDSIGIEGRATGITHANISGFSEMIMCVEL